MAGWNALLERDPMLAHAVLAHGGEWRPDLDPITNFAMNAERGLPEIQIHTTRHQMTWQTARGLIRRNQEWRNGAYAPTRWVATATIPDGWPETVLTALPGRTLDAVIDLPGACAWVVTDMARVPNFHVDLVIERVGARH